VERLRPPGWLQKPVTPPYVQYDKPPISFDGAAVGIPELDGFQVRFRAYDYGVISIALTRLLAFGWGDLIGVGQSLIENQDLEQLDDIYRFAVEQSSISRGQFLELTVVLILILELLLVFMGVMK